MTYLRRHLFVLFSVAMALALGIALGSGPLRGDDAAGSPAGLEDANATLADQVSALKAAQQFGDEAGQVAASGLLADQLTGAQVTLVVFPGIDDDRVQAAADAIETAGGTVAARISLSPTLLDTGKKTFVSSVAASSSEGLDDLGDVSADEPYAVIGALIARAYLTHADDGYALDDEATKIDSELQGAKVVSVDDGFRRRGSLAVVLAPGYHGTDAAAEANVLIASSVVEQVVGAGDAAVLVTPPSGGDAGGVLAAFADPSLSTLNVMDGPLARVAMVFALRAAAVEKAGAFGVDGTDTVLPPGMTRG